jgi:poly [ADP-ribose] polymerase
MANFVIDSASKLKEKLEMVESLAEIEIATKIIEKNKSLSDEDILNKHYDGLNCDIKGIDKNVKEINKINFFLFLYIKIKSYFIIIYIIIIINI